MDLECLQPQLFKDFNQILKSDRMNHAYLFSGDFASFDFALYLAKSRFCENLHDGRPCGKLMTMISQTLRWLSQLVRLSRQIRFVR